MLSELHIKSLATIENATLNLKEGLSVITGESGAGKSIFMRGLSLLFGSKADSTFVRSGSTSAQITGIFEDLSLESKGLLQEMGIALENQDSNETLILRRTIYADGKSKAYINDVPTAISVLKELAPTLACLFSQGEQFGLKNEKIHLELIDSFCDFEEVKQEYESTYEEAEVITKKLSKTLKDRTKSKSELDYNSFRLQEFEKLEPDLSEYNTLLDRVKTQKEVLEKQKEYENIFAIVEGSHGETNLVTQLGRIISGLERLEELNEVRSELSSAQTSLQDLSFHLSKLIEGVDGGEAADYDQAQKRLNQYQKFMREKKIDSIKELFESYQNFRSKIAAYENIDIVTLESANNLIRLADRLKKLAVELDETRIKRCSTILKDWEKNLKLIGIPSASIQVEGLPDKKINHTVELPEDLLNQIDHKKWLTAIDTISNLARHGKTAYRFLISTNTGETNRPLAKVASGGELSRIQLAFEALKSRRHNSLTYVFDEIDTGVSGKLASQIGQFLKDLAKKNIQVICISHLPQVAAFGHQHFKIKKSTKGGRARSLIQNISESHREIEIARLLSGEVISEHSKKQALTLLEQASKF